MITKAKNADKGNVSSGRQKRSENEIHELRGPIRYSVQGLAEMAQPERECPADKERFYAAAQIDAVESTGPRAEDAEELRIVLYVNRDVSRAVEVLFANSVTPHGQTPRVKDLDPDLDDIGEPKPYVREHYQKSIENHREVERRMEVPA